MACSFWITALCAVSFLAMASGQTTQPSAPNQTAPTPTFNPDKHELVDKVKHLRVTTLPHKPFVMKSQTGGDVLEGMAIDILNEAVKEIGFDDVQVDVVKDLKFGSYNKTGDSWTGMVGQLVSGEADIAVGAVTLTSKRAEDIQFTQPIIQTGFRVLYKIPEAWHPSYSMVTLLRPFSPGLWVLIVVMFFITSAGLYVIGRYSPYEDIAFVGKTATYDGLTVQNSLLYTFSTLVWQGYTSAPKSVSGRLLTCVWWVFAVFTVSAYIGGLAAILFKVNPQIRTLPFTTMEEMSRQSSVGVMIVEGGSAHRYLNQTTAKLETRIFNRIMEKKESLLIKNLEEGFLKMSLSNGAYGLLMDGADAEYLATLAPCDKMVLGEPLGHNAVAFACRNTSDVCKKMDAQILKMHESGKMAEFKEKWFHRGCMEGKPHNYIYQGLPFFDTFGGEPDIISPLTISVQRFSAAFIILLIGVVLAGVCLGAEMYYAKRRGTAVPRKLERAGHDDDMERIDNEFRDERA